MERSLDCLHVLTNYGESGYSSNGKASFSHKRCHLRATLAADFLLLSSFINQVINQWTLRIVTLAFPTKSVNNESPFLVEKAHSHRAFLRNNKRTDFAASTTLVRSMLRHQVENCQVTYGSDNISDCFCLHCYIQLQGTRYTATGQSAYLLGLDLIYRSVRVSTLIL